MAGRKKVTKKTTTTTTTVTASTKAAPAASKVAAAPKASAAAEAAAPKASAAAEAAVTPKAPAAPKATTAPAPAAPITPDQESLFQTRFARHQEELRWLYMELYDNSSMYAELCDQIRLFFNQRSNDLKDLDARREAAPDWYKQNDMLGMMLYIDNFAGTIKGVEEKLDYLEKCNVNYIHQIGRAHV